MREEGVERKLTTILCADIVGYSRLMAADEARTLASLKALRKELIEPKTAQYEGRVVKLMGDGTLMEFGSVLDAVDFAVDVQRDLGQWRADVPEDQRLTLRFGINIGDIIVEGDDIYGDGVNIACRLQGLADPGGICVARNVFDQVNGKVEVSFDDLGLQRIKNVPDPIQVYLVRPATGDSRPPDMAKGRVSQLFLPDKPSLAVLPFANLMPDKEKQFLVDGLTEDLITTLSMSSEIFVIARTSSFVFGERQHDLDEVARQLGVRYVVVGSMQHDTHSFRITAQLIEAATGGQLWTARYDRVNAELFDVRDEIIQSIAGILMSGIGPIGKAELGRQSRMSNCDFNAYDHHLRAIDLRHRSQTQPWESGKATSALAKEAFKEAIDASDPPYWPAYAGLAWQHAIDFELNYSDDRVQSAALAFEYALIAIRNLPDHYTSHWIMGWAYLFAKRDHKRAMYHYRRAHELNVGDSRMLAEMAEPLILTGQSEQAISMLKQAIRLNPMHEQWYLEILAWAYLENGQPEMTIELLTNLSELNGIWSNAVLVQAYVETGQLSHCKDHIRKIESLTKQQCNEEFSLQFWIEWTKEKPYEDAVSSEKVVDLMAKALKYYKVEC